MYKILITEKFSEQGRAILESDPEMSVKVITGLPPEELGKIIGEYDALIVRSETKVNAELIAQAKGLKIIGRAGVGVDNVDVAAASHAGIIVMNTPDGNTISAAEHTMAMILSLARNIPQAHGSMKAGKWERSKFMGVELFGKQLGIIGLGRIGGEVAKRARAFGMRIAGFDPFATELRAKELDAELMSLDELLSTSDFITVHTPKTKETAHLIGKRELELTKPGVRLINVARGGLYDELALAEAIKSGHVAGVATDVYEKEPPAPDNVLIQSDKVVVTPHLGASTTEAQENVAISLAHQVIDALKGRVIANAVNVPVIDPAEWEMLRPYSVLAERLGEFLVQYVEKRFSSLHIVYSGEVAERKTKALTLAALAAALQSALGDNVNYVNASLFAKERGIDVSESTSAATTAYTSLIRIEAKSNTGTHTVAGTLGASNEPRIVEIDGYRVDTEPAGNFLLFFNKDVPGILGMVATILGVAGVNIAGLSNGRRDLGGNAVTIIQTDQPVPPELVKKISSIEALHNVREIRV
jgi:D-3-phosphoglycerate dehydrogenase